MKKNIVNLVLSLFLSGTVAAAQDLVYCAEASPEFFSPSINYNETSFDATQQIFDNLLTFDSGTTNLSPALATRWEVSNDGLEYTFHLRHGVKWQANALFKPTRDFNADDVIFTLERAWKLNHPYFFVTHADHPYFNAMAMGEILKSVRKLDPYTIKFTLNAPMAPFAANLAMAWAGIQSAEYGAAMLKAGKSELFDQMPLGTGPFQWVDYKKDTSISFKAFDRHWAGRPKLDRLTFVIDADPVVRWTKLREGQCHVVANPHPYDIPQMQQDARVKVMSQTGLNVGFLAYNSSKKPFDDVRVRRALNMAINKRKILRALYKHTAVPAINPIPPIQWGYSRDVADDVYDPTASKRLLVEAGYADGFSTELWAMSVQRPYMPDAVGVAKMIREDLAVIGVIVDIKSPDWTQYVQGLKAGEHEMSLFGWVGGNGDPDNFLGTLLGCSAINGFNASRFCDSRYEDLIQQARRKSDRQERSRLYESAQVIAKEQAPWLTLSHAIQFKTVRREVIGFELSPVGRLNFHRVQIAAEP